MRKMYLLMLTLLLAAATCTACAPTPAPSLPPTSSAPESSSDATPPESSSQSEESSAPELLVVADAAMYRGTVTNVEDTPDGKIITLEQAKGILFGNPSQKFRITADTKLSFSEPIAAKDTFYYEVYYGAMPGENLAADEARDVIAMNRYFDAAAVNFNGTLKEILPSDKAGAGQLVMEDMENQQEVVFNYSADTQFYLDFDALKPGDKLNIFHRGIYTMSLPPQGLPLEVRYYAEPAAA